jgi:two-component system KDP operon response regulator KdpE
MSNVPATILVVEDELEIRRFLHSALSDEGYKIVEAATVKRGAIDATTHKPDLIIVDLGLPDGDGLDLIHRIREWSPMPILVLSARAQERSKIEALDAGADDYITKPFAVGELLARVRVALRHAARGGSGETTIRIGDVLVDLEARKVLRGEQEIHLTPVEFRILACLAKHVGMVVTHRQLLTEVWGPTHASDTHYLRVYMKQIRNKLEADPVRPRYFTTETGIGYRLVATDF